MILSSAKSFSVTSQQLLPFFDTSQTSKRNLELLILTQWFFKNNKRTIFFHREGKFHFSQNPIHYTKFTREFEKCKDFHIESNIITSEVRHIRRISRARSGQVGNPYKKILTPLICRLELERSSSSFRRCRCRGRRGPGSCGPGWGGGSWDDCSPWPRAPLVRVRLLASWCRAAHTWAERTSAWERGVISEGSTSSRWAFAYFELTISEVMFNILIIGRIQPVYFLWLINCEAFQTIAALCRSIVNTKILQI